MIALWQRRWLWLSLLIAIVMRIFVWVVLPRAGWISDEGEYLSAATWISYGRGFAWYLDFLWTRAPLYPLFVAAHLRVGGNEYWVFFSQMLLSLLHVVLVRAIAQRLYPIQSAVADMAGLITALALPLAVFAMTVLSETLFLTFFLIILWLALGFQIASPSLWRAALIGIFLALATLTRGIMLAFVPFVAVWMCWGGSRLPPEYFRKRVHAVIAMLICYFVLLMPWSWYASRTFGGSVLVDTSAAYNTLLTAQTTVYGAQSGAALEGYVGALMSARVTPPTPTCAPHPGYQAMAAARQQAMMTEALCLITTHPAAFVARVPAQFVDFWQIHYASAERFTKGFTLGTVPSSYITAVLLFDDLWYILVLIPAIVGLWVLRRDGATRSQHELFLVWFCLPVIIGVVFFSITRFRIILLPLMSITAAATLVFLLQKRWRELLQPLPGLVIASALVVWSLAATPLASMSTAVPPSFFGPSPSVVFCLDLAHKAVQLRTNSIDFLRMLYVNPWTMPIPTPLPAPLDTLAPALQANWRGDIAQTLALLPVDDRIETQVIRADIALGLRLLLCLGHRHAPDSQRHHHIVQGTELGQQVMKLVDEPEQPITRLAALRFRHLVEALSCQPDFAIAGLVEAAQQMEQRALARSRSTHDRHSLAGVDLQIDARQDGQLIGSLVVVARQIAAGEHRLITHSAAPPPASPAKRSGSDRSSRQRPARRRSGRSRSRPTNADHWADN